MALIDDVIIAQREQRKTPLQKTFEKGNLFSAEGIRSALETGGKILNSAYASEMQRTFDRGLKNISPVQAVDLARREEEMTRLLEIRYSQNMRRPLTLPEVGQTFKTKEEAFAQFPDIERPQQEFKPLTQEVLDRSRLVTPMEKVFARGKITPVYEGQSFLEPFQRRGEIDVKEDRVLYKRNSRIKYLECN